MLVRVGQPLAPAAKGCWSGWKASVSRCFFHTYFTQCEKERPKNLAELTGAAHSSNAVWSGACDVLAAKINVLSMQRLSQLW